MHEISKKNVVVLWLLRNLGFGTQHEALRIIMSALSVSPNMSYTQAKICQQQQMDFHENLERLLVPGQPVPLTLAVLPSPAMAPRSWHFSQMKTNATDEL